MVNFARSAVRNTSEIYLHHEVDSTLAIFRNGLERHNIEVEMEVSSDLPPLNAIQADVEQLLLNLIANARDAMPQGGRLTIQAWHEGEQVELRISDTGCGIPTDILPQVLEPFFTTKPSGSGLGLAICRSIVSQIGGRLGIESKVGQGTTVRVSFPLSQEAHA
jgi:signal transduction histidine kinase